MLKVGWGLRTARVAKLTILKPFEKVRGDVYAVNNN
jgi:hypothetical protein